MSKIKKSATVNSSQNKLEDSWNLAYASREEMKFQPTGTYKVAMLENTKDEVVEYFSQYGECHVCGYKKTKEYLIIFTGRWCLPKPSAKYLNGELLKTYHISRDNYWNYTEKHNKKFSKACNWFSSDSIKVERRNYLDVLNSGELVYPKTIMKLPPYTRMEAFERLVKNSGSTMATMKFPRDNYCAFIKWLSTSFYLDSKFPIIVSTVIRSINKIDHTFVTINFFSYGGILTCVRSCGNFRLEILGTAKQEI